MFGCVIGPRQQGDLGEASALEWLVGKGAHVDVPFNHSPDFDLVAEMDGRLLRVQVKTSRFFRDGRYCVMRARRSAARVG